MSQPDIIFKHGACNAAVFTKEVTKGDRTFTSRTVSFQKRYRDKQGEWQSTSYLDVNDLPKAMLVLNKAFDYCTSNGYNQDAEVEE